MNLQVDDESVTYLLNGLESLLSTWNDYGYKVEDVIKIATIHTYIKNYINRRIKELDSEPPEPETLSRPPNKGERMVLGKEKYQH